MQQPDHHAGRKLTHEALGGALGSPMAVIVMGVSGCGKSTLGARLADMLEAPFLEGDAFHDEAAIAKMRAGEPLTDDDRWPWLDRLGRAMSDAVATRGGVVAACSALRGSYRQRLREAIGAPTCFLLLDNSRDELMRRLQARPNHYMPASLLDSQLAILERPQADEPAVILDGADTTEALCEAAMTWLAEARQRL